jgi:hypothetical protein
MESCGNFMTLAILILTGLIFYFTVRLFFIGSAARKAQAPILTPFGCMGDLGGFHFVLKNDGPTRVKELDEPRYDKELLGEYDIDGQYIQTQDAKGQFDFSKSSIAPQEQVMIRFRKRNGTKSINYKGEWKVIIKYKGDFFKPKTRTLIFKVDTDNGTIIPLNFK